MNNVRVLPGQDIVEIGAGARWKTVYTVLAKHNAGIAGARTGSVGVGGFLLGGKNLQMPV